ncbi:MAG: protein adenylyltransferase SelO [Pontibacterium sp.]
MSPTSQAFSALTFDNTFTELPSVFYRHVLPQPLKAPFLISVNTKVAELLGLDADQLDEEGLAAMFGGDDLHEAFEPLAMKYTGHQFGQYNPDLGDGRGVLLGEVVNPNGRRFDLHLKGAGQTPFSRMGDGRAVLRSSIREYLCSEAMYALGIPTSRALTLVGSETQVMRNGVEPCAAVLRVTECHIRFGHFEYLYYSRQHEQLKVLADYCIERYYAQLKEHEKPYLSFYKEVAQRTARLFALWQAYGFVHGVLNTDNMSILGESFDYGPFTFMDGYEPGYISNKNDHSGRYAFEQQPNIMIWNLAALGQALLPLVEREDLESVLGQVKAWYDSALYGRMAARLGLSLAQDNTVVLIDQLLATAKLQKLDMTRFLRALTEWDFVSRDTLDIADVCAFPKGLDSWLDSYEAAFANEPGSVADKTQRMAEVNPKYILRNYMAEEAIKEAHNGNHQPVNDLLTLLSDPFNPQAGAERFAGPPPDWAAAIYLTCSS